jgi:hypothetical protein
MGEVQFAVHQLVAHAGPAGLLARHDLDAVFLVDAEHRGHHHAGAVGERDEADLDFFLFGLVGALGPDGGAQCGVEADHARGGGLQHSAATQCGFQRIGHGCTPGSEEAVRKNKKGALTTHGPLENEPLRDKDAFVRFGGPHPPLDAACLKTSIGLWAGRCKRRARSRSL